VSAAVLEARAAARRSAHWRERRQVLTLMAPWIIGFSLFFAFPLITSFYYSFNHYDLLSSPRWVGLANYKYMFKDPEVGPAIKNTLWLIVFMVPAQVIFGLGVALALSRARRGASIFRAIFYLPTLVPSVAGVLGFIYLFNPATGPVNTILGKLGIDGPLWFNSPHWSKPALVLLALWTIGDTMIIFLAAVLDVPKHLKESAALDGAGPLQSLLRVTLPSVSPVILFSAVTAVIAALQYFTEAYVVASATQGGHAAAVTASNLGYPQGSTLFYPILLYTQGFQRFNMGYAAALTMLLLVVSLVVTLVILRNAKRWVHAEGEAR
jgi:multiple sugar transport system permease protein